MKKEPSMRKSDDSLSKQHSKICCSFRLVLIFLGFFGYFNLYFQRVNLSFAMMCMVNHSAIRESLEASNLSTETQVSACKSSFNETDVDLEDGDLKWSKSIQGVTLGSFFWGYVTTQMFGGWLSMKLGGRIVFGVSMLICSVLTLFMPAAARIHYGFLMGLRIVAGICQGVVWPAGHNLFARWIPPLERSRLLGTAFAGAVFGNIVTFPMSGLLCRSSYGWPSIFYINGIVGLIWVTLWFVFVSDTPGNNRWINERERIYIQESLKYVVSKKTKRIPVSKILTSPPVWAIVGTHTCSNWGSYLFLTQFPTYFKEVSGFDAKTNGFTTGIPYAGYYVMLLSSANIADCLRKKGILSTTACRKLFSGIGNLTPAVLAFLVTFLGCDLIMVAVAFLIMASAFMGNNHGSGYLVNPNDIAPDYAGIIYGISNTFATIPGMIGPSIISKLTENRTREEWNTVFYITSAGYAIGALIYLAFGSGEIQEWAKPEVEREKDEMLLEERNQVQTI